MIFPNRNPHPCPRLLRRLWRETEGSSDVLYAVVVAFFMAIVLFFVAWIGFILVFGLGMGAMSSSGAD